MTKKTVIIGFKTPTVKQEKNFVRTEDVDMVESVGGTIKHTHNSINAITVEIESNKIKILKANSNIKYIEEDQEAKILVNITIIKDEMLKDVDTNNIIQWGVIKIRATEVHTTGNKGFGIKGVIIDTGIDYTHPNLKDNYKGGYNFINNTDDPMDNNGHGSHVTGIASATDIGNGLIGVAPEMDIYSYKVLDANGSGSYSNIIAAIQKAIDDKMQIINMSLGGSGFSQALNDICNAAYNAGIVIIAAAGNSGNGSDKIGYPAKFDSVIAVGATDSNDLRASFSSTGPKLEVCAPGVSIPSSVPSGICSLCDTSKYKNLSGTSMSTPHVFGTVALILNENSNLKNTEIRNIINNSVYKTSSNPTRNIYYGYGRVDTKKAIDNQDPTPPKYYSCTGKPDYRCIEDPNGIYQSIEDCQAACKAPTPSKKYSCVNGACIEDSNGIYPDLSSCQSKCKLTPPPSNKYTVRKIGSMGIIVLKNIFGNVSADDACAEVCKILKEIDSK